MILMNKNNMKKILIIHNKYQNIGGEDIAVDQEVNIFGLINSNNKKSNEILNKTLKEFNPNIVYVHNTWFKASLGIFNILKSKNIKTVIKLHNFRYDCTRFHRISNHLNKNNICFRCGIDKTSFNFYNKYFAESYIKSFLINNYGKKYFNIIKSEDLNIFVLTNFHKEYLRNLNIKTKSIYTQTNFMNFENNIQSLKPKNEFTYAGRISKEKGISELIKSFKDSNLKDYVLNIIGTGPMLKQLSDENQIYPNIRFYGEMDNSKVIEIIKSSKAVVTSTKMYEGQPTVLCEASVNKVPSIFPNFGGISEFFPVDYDLSFKQFDYEDLTQKFVYASKNDLYEYGSKNYEFLKSKLNDDFLIKRFNLLLEENE
jgi:glycosyltransferase involved in cell wall biosynthesis